MFETYIMNILAEHYAYSCGTNQCTVMSGIGDAGCCSVWHCHEWYECMYGAPEWLLRVSMNVSVYI